jgi:hypothetical protein
MLPTIIAAALLLPTLAWADDLPAPVPRTTPGGAVSVGAPPSGPPAGPEVPVVIKCYRRDTVPFLLTDQDGKILFEIRCPP